MQAIGQVLAERMEKIANRAQASQRNQESTNYECERCKDNGVVVVITETGEEVPIADKRMFDEQYRVRDHTTKPCGCSERKRIERLFKSSHITDQFRTVGFRSFITDGRPECVKAAYDLALDYYNRFDEIRDTTQNSIQFCGPPGAGKTHLLMAISNNLMKRGVSVAYFPYVEGFNDIKKDLDAIEERVSALKKVDVLYIDDLYKGRNRPTEFMLEQLFGIVNYRYLNCKPMMVSTERTTEEMFDIDEGVARRIHERCGGHRLLMGLTQEEERKQMILNYSLAVDKQ